MKIYNKILFLSIVFLGFLSYVDNQAFADRTCANGVTVCKEPEKTKGQAHAEIATYLENVGVGYDLNYINYTIRKDRVDCAHCSESDYKFTEHVITDIEWRNNEVWLHCNNGADRVKMDGDTESCNHETWSCEWTNCPVITPRENCKNTCTQRYICTKSITTGSCPSTTTGSDESREEIIPLTQTGCEFECGTADGVTFSYNEVDWGSKTLCKQGTANPTNPKFPDIGGKTSWTCNYNTNSAYCNAFRSISGGPSSECGDGERDSGEDCDDGNRNDTDFCPNNCKLRSDPITYCGDGKIQSPEQCDDNNNINFDGCSAICEEEKDPPIIEGGYCGDGEVQKPNADNFNESCDDGNNNSNDACTNNCTAPHTGIPGEKGYCGDGKIQKPNYFGFNESCDDGNINSNDACTNNCTDPHTSLPGGADIYAYSTCNLSGSGYANNSDTNTIYMKISAIPGINGGKDVVNLGTPTDFKDLSNNLSDRVNNKGESSLSFTGIEVRWRGNDEYMPIAKVTSVTPFASCGNKISFKLNGSTIILNNVGYNFKKPFIGDLKATDNNGNTWSGAISLGTKMKYKLSAIPKSSLNSYSLSLKPKDISFIGTGITLQNTTLLQYSGNGFYNFYTRINSSRFAKKLNQNPSVQVILPNIYYSLGGKNVRYYLSEFDYGNDKTPIKMKGSVFVGIKIIGGLQGAGKYEFTGQGKNISNLYPSNLRTEIRKRAYDYTKNMKDGDIFNKVKYVEGKNITISGSLDYETLVVKDGNVVILGDLNTLNRKLGIIVLKDSYDVNTSYNDVGNVYVGPDVTKLNAMIYADGGFISSHSNNSIPYTKDSPERTDALQKQLFMNGILFTRNTIGGSQYVGGYYSLPGGSKTADFDKAMVYDLNYIRRGNVGCDKSTIPNGCTDSGEYEEGFIIKYDSRIQTSPPKLFSK